MLTGDFIAAAIAAMPDEPCSTRDLAEVICYKTDLGMQEVCRVLGRMAENQLRGYASRSGETKTMMGRQIRPWIWQKKKPGVQPAQTLERDPDRLDEIIELLNAVLLRLDKRS